MRILILTLYYLAIIAGLVVTHMNPDYGPTAFVYQAF
jgi:hypothetical protein